MLFLAPCVRAQTVYTWKDDKGVVHFSDESPEGVKGVEKLTLEAPAPLISETEGEGAPEGGGESQMVVTPAAGSPEGGAQPQAAAPSGPSEVVVLGAELSPLSATERKVRGRLRNIGGRDARRVSVRVVIADGDTGNLCLTGDIDASPTNLGPGENGAFEGDLNTPCFYGNPKIAYYPEWD